jgi:hypothetical protein
VLTNGAVIGALARAAARGVALRVWRDGEMAEKAGESDISQRLGAPLPAALQVRTKPPGELMHLKDFASIAPRSAPVRPISALPARGGRTMTSSSYADLRPARYLKRSSRGRGRASPEAPPG